MSNDKDHALAVEAAKDEDLGEREVYLEHGRTLTVGRDGLDEVIEIRASSGQVELRVVLTEGGPVLRLDGVKLAVNAVDEIDLKCRRFAVDAAEAVSVHSDGELEVASEGDTRIRATKDVRVNGEKIFLN